MNVYSPTSVRLTIEDCSSLSWPSHSWQRQSSPRRPSVGNPSCRWRSRCWSCKYFPVKGDRLTKPSPATGGRRWKKPARRPTDSTEEIIARPARRLPLPRLQGQDGQAQPQLQGRGDLRVPGAAADRAPSSGDRCPDDRLQQDHGASRHQAVGRGEGRQGSLDLGLPRRRGRALGIQHGRAVRRHQQQQPRPQGPAGA